MDQTRAEARKVLEQGDNFLVASHYNPDGDALGSLAAMGFVLDALGKNYRLYNISGVPEPFDWLELPATVVSSLAALDGFRPDWYITLDCGDTARLGAELMENLSGQVLNLDHHLGNPMFGTVNWVDPSMTSVGEMVAHLANDMGIPLTGPLGEAIYLAIITDTGNFRYGNTTPETLELAATIMRQGLNPAEFNSKFMKQWSLERLFLWSEVMGQAKVCLGGRVGVLHITAETLKKTGTSIHDCDGLVNYARYIRGVRIGMILREDAPGLVKFSLRSEGDDNVQAVAKSLGGGGHKNASAGSIRGSMHQAENLVLGALANHFGLDKKDQTCRRAIGARLNNDD